MDNVHSGTEPAAQGIESIELAFADEYWSIFEAIESAETIAISGHTSPDGDALGSTLGLGLALRGRFPRKKIAFLLADDAPVPRIYRFLAGSDELVPASRYELNPDLFISVDCPVLERLENAAAVARRSCRIVCFDHHPAREEFAHIAIRRPEAAAASVIIEEFLSFCNITITPEVANCLFCGLVTDTGRFQYQNTDPESFCVASRLVAAGAEPARISLEVYQSQRIEYLHLESIVMGRICTVADGKVAYSFARAEDLARCGVSTDECDGLVDLVRSVGGVEVCVFLKGLDDGRVRGNLRSKSSIDISGVAAAFNGGGHAAAAGFTFEGSIEDALDAVLPLLAALVRGEASLGDDAAPAA